jgi:pimeloyl-ACP methyl ester carboxylesterase
MPEVSVRCRSLAFEVRPTVFESSALSVVFIHGTGGDREDWRAQWEGLSDVATIMALELPGHGSSDPPGESEVDAYARCVTGFVDELQLRKVVLVGCSLGSAITQWIALSRPEWLTAIGLVGAGARLRVHPDFLEGLGRDSDAALSLLADFALSPKTRGRVREEVTRKYRAARPELISGDLSACNAFDVMEKLSEIAVPAQIIVGEDDRLTPVKYSRLLHERIAGSRLAIIPDAGHLVMMEQPEEFNRHMKGFLRGLPA